MAIAWMDGFDAIGGDASALQTWLTAAGFGTFNFTRNNCASVEVDQGRAIQLKISTAKGNPSIVRGVTGDVAVFSFALSATDGRARVCSVNGVAVDWSTRTGRLQIGDTQGQDVLILGQRWQFDVVANRTEGTLDVWVNGGDSPQLSATGLHFDDGNLTITWGQEAAAETAVTLVLDDVLAIDASAGSYVAPARLPTRRIVTSLPTEDARAEWELPAGSVYTSHAGAIGQILSATPTTAALQSNQAGAVDLYSTSALTSALTLEDNPQVLAVAVTAYAKKGDLDDRHLGLALGSDGEVGAEVSRSLEMDYRFHQAVWEQQPDGSAWGNWPLSSLQFGIVTR